MVLEFSDPDGCGEQSMALSKRYLYGEVVDQILAQEDVTKDISATDRILWPLVDNLGTVRDLAKQDGTIATHFTYDSYGNVVSGDTSLTRYLFTSREWDPATELQSNRARWYDPAVGRWLSEDPIGFVAGDANVQRYVRGTVTVDVDSTGLSKGRKGPRNVGDVVSKLPEWTRYWIVIAVSKNAAGTGHAWIGLIDTEAPTDGELIVGLHPKGGWKELTRNDGRAPGIIEDDSDSSFDVARAYPLFDKDTYDKVKKTIDEKKSAPDLIYDINYYNCVGFALDILDRAGRTLSVDRQTSNFPQLDVPLGARPYLPINLYDALMRDADQPTVSIKFPE